MPQEINSYCKWLGVDMPEHIEVVIFGEKNSEINICDADSNVLFGGEKGPLSIEEYEKLKNLALKSAKDFHAQYEAVSEKNAADSPQRKTFYDQAPRARHRGQLRRGVGSSQGLAPLYLA